MDNRPQSSNRAIGAEKASTDAEKSLQLSEDFDPNLSVDSTAAFVRDQKRKQSRKAVKSPVHSSNVSPTSPRKDRAKEILGVSHRTPMGDFIPPQNGKPLSQLAMPSPGPQSYYPKLPHSGYEFSILGKHGGDKDFLLNEGPGPQKYDIRSVRAMLNETPRWTFGKRLSFPQSNAGGDVTTPSPFAYNIQTTFGKTHVAASMSGRFPETIEETPSPGQYFPAAGFGPTGDGPKYSFGHRPFAKDEPTPGPLDYDVPREKPDAPSGPSFTIRQRLQNGSFTSRPGTVPAPNKYDPKLPSTEKYVTLKGIHDPLKSLQTPAPGSYYIPSSIQSGPQFTLTARNIPYSDEVDSTPSPAAYFPSLNASMTTSPKYTLGARPKMVPKEKVDIPGPNHYNPDFSAILKSEKGKVTLKGRYGSKKEVTPGPADYCSHADIVPVSAEHLVRNANRKAPRDRLKQNVEMCPGPASYSVQMASVKSAGPKYSLRKRLDSNKVNDTPGPNAYRAEPKLDGPKVTMKSRASPFVMVFPSTRVNTLRI